MELPNRRQDTVDVPTLSPTHDSRKRVAPRATGNTQGRTGWIWENHRVMGFPMSLLPESDEA